MFLHKFSKKLLSVILIFSIMITCISCQKAESEKEAVMPTGSIFTEYKDRFEKYKTISVDKTWISAVKQFSNNLASELLVDASDNKTFSPLSVYFALSILAEGSNKKTADELFQTLGVKDVTYDEFAKQIDTLYQYYYLDNEYTTLKISNAVWMNDQFHFLDSYGDQIANKYHSSIYCVDYADPKTKLRMEDWAAKAVNNLMQPEISIDPQQALAIMNTIYYTDQWEVAFKKELTKKEDFKVSEEETVSCDFMHKETGIDHYYQGNGFKAYQILLVGGGAMMIYLPEEGVSLDDLIDDHIVPCEVDEIQPIEARMKISMPKFSYGCKLDLKETLQKLGIHDAFNENADFSRMCKQELSLDTATQDMHISIDEDGVTGAAFTLFMVRNTGTQLPDDIVDFNCNRPFLYQIISFQGVPVCTGIVHDPSKTN